MLTPLGALARHVTVPHRALVWASTASLIVSVLIVIGGGIVRTTGSGLGCPTWPQCEAGSLTTTPALGIHGFIEFANRVLTGVLIVTVAAVIVTARLQKLRDRRITRPAWAQFWLVVANAVVGGITVLTDLNPWIVAGHFVAATGLLTTTTITWHRVRQLEHRNGSSSHADPVTTRLGSALLVVTGVLVIAGTLVSGSGPHSGDSAEVARMPFDWIWVTVVHATLGGSVLVLGIVVAVRLWRTARTSDAAVRARLFVVIVSAQAAIGAVQSLTGLPGVLVVVHLLGAALVWIGALRLYLDLHPPRRIAASTPGTPSRLTSLSALPTVH